MTKTIPSYLRVHRESDSIETGNRSSSSSEHRDPAEGFWNAYSLSTGWRIDQRVARAGNIHLLAAVDTQTVEDPDAGSLVSKSDATRLAESGLELTKQLADAREALRSAEAELAVRAAIVTGANAQIKLGEQLQTTLEDAAAACGCDSAAMYMLDDQTQYLKARAVFGLPPSRLEKERRELRGSRADLEAMVQGVVLINDLNECSIDTWSCPEDVAAGICAVILCDDVPVGTLWLYANEPVEFGSRESAAARMAAAQLALVLSTASGQAAPKSAAENPIRDVAQWQCEALPVGASLADGWRVDGMIESPESWATGFHHWDVLPDGTLMLVIAEAVDASAKGAMAATIARAAMASHCGYRHSPAQLLQRVSDTLWQTSTGEQLTNMLYARIDPETGEGEVAAAGSISAMIGSRYGYRPLTSGNSDPLNQHIDARVITDTFRMMSGETLLAYSQGMTAEMSQTQLGDGIRTAMQSGDINPLAALRRTMAGLPMDCERGAVSLLRI